MPVLCIHFGAIVHAGQVPGHASSGIFVYCSCLILGYDVLQSYGYYFIIATVISRRVSDFSVLAITYVSLGVLSTP